MKIIIAPDSYKGTMTAKEAAVWIEKRLRERYPDAEFRHLPVGDGGEGTADAIIGSLPSSARIEKRYCDTIDPIGRPLEAPYYLIENDGKTYALLESAAAGGLNLLEPRERNIFKASSQGVGYMIEEAMMEADEIVVCMGGTAFCDGGGGALSVLLFTKADVGSKHFALLCDVDSPYCGPMGAALTFAMQKGASRSQLPILEREMQERARKFRDFTGVDVTDEPYAGAAGGLAGMLMAYFESTPVRGINHVLDMIGFEKELEDADIVVTGEGRADFSTLAGKAPMGVLEAVKNYCKKSGREIPVVLMPGCFDEAAREALEEAGFTFFIE